MMIWIGWSSDDQDRYIIGIFSSEEKAHAERSVKSIEMWDLDEVAPFASHS